MQFLFERLRAPSLVTDPVERLRTAIHDQLQWLVGSREWRAEQEGAGLLDVAMPELPSLSVDGAQVRRYAERLRRLIERHEPRLKRPRVELKDTGRSLSPFAVIVHGTMDTDHGVEELRFEYAPGQR